MSDKYCVDCKHCDERFGPLQGYIGYDAISEVSYLCRNPKLGKDLVTGQQVQEKCSKARTDRLSFTSDGWCGAAGEWFEEKESK